MKVNSEEWKIIEKYSVTNFDKEGNNIYLGEEGFFYIDKIDMSNKELIIEKFDNNRKLIDTIRTGIIYEKTKSNTYLHKNEKIAIFFNKQFIYLYYPGRRGGTSFDEIWEIDLKNKKNYKIVSLQLENYGGGTIFGILKRWKYYDEGVWDFGDISYQMKLVIENNNILIDGYFRSDDDEGGDSAHNYYVFDRKGVLIESAFTRSYENYKNIYPIFIKEDGEIVKGMLAEEEMEKLANNIGYTIKAGATYIYRSFINTDLYIDKGGYAWLSKDIWKAGTKKRDDINYESSIYGLVRKNGEWNVTEFIHPFNFHELRYNVFVDRIIKAEGNKLWLWVRIGHNITGPYEDRYFDREIWVIDKK